MLMIFLAAALLLGTAGAEETEPAEGVFSKQVLAEEASAENEGLVSGEFYYDPLTQMYAPEDGLVELQGMETTFLASHETYRDQLDTVGKRIYDALEEGLANGCYSIQVSLSGVGTDKATVERYLYGAYAAYDNDHPLETCGTTREVGYSGYGSTYTLNVKVFYDDASYANLKRTALAKAVEAFYEQFADDGMTTKAALDQYRYIYEYLGENCYYNYPVLNDELGGTNKYDDEIRSVVHNAFGALVGFPKTDGAEQGAVVCQGYADAYLLLCQRAGLPCVVVSGEARENKVFTGAANHMWNAIKLDGKWYAVDVTWDDCDMTYSNETNPGLISGVVDVSMTEFQYFTDNRYFLTQNSSMNDHRVYSQCTFDDIDWTIGAPPLENVRLAAADLTASRVQLFLDAPEGGDTAFFSDAILLLNQSFTVDIPTAEIYLKADTQFDSTCTVPAERGYHVFGKQKPALTRSDDFSDPMFYVENSGYLSLCNVMLDGEKKEAAPMVLAPDSSEEGRSRILLIDASVTGNRGACGISTDGLVILSGKCQVWDNQSSDDMPENLTLRENGIVLTDQVSGSQIGVTTVPNFYFAAPYSTGNWTEEDRAVFVSDDSQRVFGYDPVRDMMYCSRVATSNQGQSVYVTYVERLPSASCVSGHSVTLTNTTVSTKSVVLYAAMYDVNHKMLQICEVSTPVLEAGATSEQIVLPEAAEGTVVYSLLVLDHGGMSCIPLSQCIRYDFTSEEA